MKKLKKVEVKVDDKKEVKPATEQRTGGNVSLQDSLQDAMKKLKKVDDKEEVKPATEQRTGGNVSLQDSLQNAKKNLKAIKFENKNLKAIKNKNPIEAKILLAVAEGREADPNYKGSSTSDSEEESSEW